MTKIFQMSDNHLGCLQYSLDERLDDFDKAYRSGIKYAIDNDYDAVIHTGDLFHHNKPRPSSVDVCIDGIKKLEDNNIPTYLIMGNHESLTVTDTQWIDMLCNTTHAEKLGTKPKLVGDISIYGLNNRKGSGFDSINLKKPESDNAILCVHEEISDFVGYGSESLSAEELVNSVPDFIDHIALGDIHKFETKNVDGTSLAYAGSPERTQISQSSGRTYAEIESNEGGDISVTPINVNDCPYDSIPRNVCEVNMNLYSDDTRDDVCEKVKNRVQSSLDGCILRVKIEDDKSSLSTNDIRKACEDKLNVLITRVSGTTNIDFDNEYDSVDADEISNIDNRIQEAIKTKSEYDSVTESISKAINNDLDENHREYFTDKIVDGDDYDN